MSRKRSSSKRVKRALKQTSLEQANSTVTQNTAKIKQPKQKKVSKPTSTSMPVQLSSGLPSRADISRAKSQAFKTAKKDRQYTQKQDIDIDKMVNKAVASKISKQDYKLKEKAAAEVGRMAKTLNRRLNKFKNEEGFDEKRRRLDEEEYKKVEAEKQKFDARQISEEDMYDSKYYAGHQVYLQILAMIEDAERSNNPPFMFKHANSLNSLLDKEIFNFGFDKVMKSMAEAPEELIYYARQSIDASDDETSKNYRYHLMSLIEANIPTTEEAKDANDYEESASEQTSEDYDKAEDTGWQVVGQNEIPKDWLINAENDLPDDW